MNPTRFSWFKIWIAGSALAILFSLFTPILVSASSSTYTVRFTAIYKSGNSGSKNVYYVLDDGSAHHLGTVSGSSNGDFTFSATFSYKVRVYVEIGDDAVYHSHLYINGDVVASGDVGNGGLSYSRSDSTSPSGRITSPINGMTINQCPLIIMTNVSDDNSGVAWVVYNVFYDGSWHQIASDDSASGAEGWSTIWDCNSINDQSIKLGIVIQDFAGNKVVNPNGVVVVNLAKGGTIYPTTQPGQGIGAPIITATLASAPGIAATVQPASVLPTAVPPTVVPISTQLIPEATPTLEATKTVEQGGLKLPDSSKVLFVIPTIFGNFIFVWNSTP